MAVPSNGADCALTSRVSVGLHDASHHQVHVRRPRAQPRDKGAKHLRQHRAAAPLHAPLLSPAPLSLLSSAAAAAAAVARRAPSGQGGGGEDDAVRVGSGCWPRSLQSACALPHSLGCLTLGSAIAHTGRRTHLHVAPPARLGHGLARVRAHPAPRACTRTHRPPSAQRSCPVPRSPCTPPLCPRRGAAQQSGPCAAAALPPCRPGFSCCSCRRCCTSTHACTGQEEGTAVGLTARRLACGTCARPRWAPRAGKTPRCCSGAASSAPRTRQQRARQLRPPAGSAAAGPAGCPRTATPLPPPLPPPWWLLWTLLMTKLRRALRAMRRRRCCCRRLARSAMMPRAWPAWLRGRCRACPSTPLGGCDHASSAADGGAAAPRRGPPPLVLGATAGH